MRIPIISILISLSSLVSAQSLEHNFIFNVGGGVSGTLDDIQQVAISVRAGTTNKKKLAVGLDFGYQSLQIKRAAFELIGVGPFLRIYPNGVGKSGPFIGGEAGYASVYERTSNSKGGGSGFFFGPSLGLNFLMTEKVAFEFQLNAQKIVNTQNANTSSWGMIMEIGTVLFL